MSVIAELKRRNVVRVAVLYGLAAWLILQVADVLVPALGLPDWVMRLVALLLFLGFPLVLIFSWVYELTPEGLKKQHEVDRDQSITHETGRKINYLIGALAVLAIAVVAAERFMPRTEPIPLATDAAPPVEAPAQAAAKSIAVLPFVNMSNDPDQEYFSDGMTEELLNVLARRLPKVKVAARTSVFEFKGKGGDVREIGRRLGVTHIVEGSVRREGKHVRVTAQLVRVADGFHIWSDSFDRELESVFALQDDIARQIAEQLETKLGLAEAPSARVAIDFWAFDEYLKGRTLYRQRKDLPEAIAHLQAAVDRAPEFGEAWATLSLAHESARFNTTLEQRAVLGNALSNMLTAAEHALALDPDAALTLHAQGNVRRGEARYAEAEQLYLRAMEADSTYPDVREDYAELLNHVGRHEDALVAARALVELEPFVANFWRRIADVGVSLDRRTLVEEAQDRMREIDPSAPSGVLADFYFEFWQGRIEPAREALAEAKRFSPTAAAPAVELFQWSERNASIDDSHARRLIVGGPTHYAPFAAHRGDADVYFAAFEDPLTHFSYYFRYALPVTAPLLGDPRGEEMLRRYGFVAYWREKGWPAYCRPLDDDDFECGPAVKELRMTE